MSIWTSWRKIWIAICWRKTSSSIWHKDCLLSKQPQNRITSKIFLNSYGYAHKKTLKIVSCLFRPAGESANEMFKCLLTQPSLPSLAAQMLPPVNFTPWQLVTVEWNWQKVGHLGKVTPPESIDEAAWWSRHLFMLQLDQAGRPEPWTGPIHYESFFLLCSMPNLSWESFVASWYVSCISLEHLPNLAPAPCFRNACKACLETTATQGMGKLWVSLRDREASYQGWK